MPKYVVERDVSGVGKSTSEELHGLSKKSCGALPGLGPVPADREPFGRCAAAGPAARATSSVFRPKIPSRLSVRGLTVVFFVSLLVDGALAGAIYALIALAFVVVYKASRMINFALGEWVMLASVLVAVGLHAMALSLLGALGLAGLGMVALAFAFSRAILRRLVGQPLISLIMVTLGLGALIRGAVAAAFRGIPNTIPLPIPPGPIVLHGVSVATDKLAAALIAAMAIAAVSWFFRRSRTGVALQAIADDQQAAMGVGIDLHWHFALTWALMGALCVLGGTLWTFISGGGFGIVLVGLKVFPIVIIGGLDSIPGSIVGAMAVGILEALAAGYLDPFLGGGFSNVASYLVLIAMLFVRPYGLFGRSDIARV